jgi:glycosyltransferase involved in cell wall biosynthesis
MFFPGYKEKYDDSKFNYKVVRCKSIKTPLYVYPLPLPAFDKKFQKELYSYNLDIVHIHSPFMMGKAGLKYAKAHNIPIVGTMHSQFEQDFKRAFKSDFIAKQLNKSLIIKTFEQCDECWAVNKEVGRIFHEDYGYSKVPRTMDNATEMLPVENKEKVIRDIKAKHDIKDEIVFLFVGRINKLKNIFFIIDALEHLGDKLNFKMIFVGDGPDEKEFKERVNSSSIKDRVIFTGKITDRELIAKYFATADLFLFPSLYDASSIVQIEAASQGTPGLFLKEAATAATVTDNVTGYLSDNSPEAYAKKIIEIFSDINKHNQIRENAFKDLYVNWDDKIDEVFNLYQKIIKEKEEK